MARKKKKKHSEEEGGEAWLLPYSDLMTLLLAVFIVLFATSKMDESKAKELAGEFRETMMTGEAGSQGIFPGDDGSSVVPISDEMYDVMPSEEPTGSADGEASATPSAEGIGGLSQDELKKYLGAYEFSNLAELKSQLDTMFEKEGVSADIPTYIDTRGLVISLDNAILFSSGSAEIKPENEEALLKIAASLGPLENYIRIEGHTDNIPISTKTYPSNWELSTARASSVVRLFIEQCNVSPEKVVAVGYGEFKPVADNATLEGRAKNRRIDIIVLSEKYNNLEKQVTTD